MDDAPLLGAHLTAHSHRAHGDFLSIREQEEEEELAEELRELAKLAVLTNMNKIEDEVEPGNEFGSAYGSSAKTKKSKWQPPAGQHHYHDEVIIEKDHSVWEAAAANSHATAQTLQLPPVIHHKEEEASEASTTPRPGTKVRFDVPENEEADTDTEKTRLSDAEKARLKHELIMKRQDVFSAAELLAIRVEFNKVDVDGSGSIDATELGTIIRNLGGQISDEHVEKILKEIDEDGSGEVDWVEYLALMSKMKNGDKSETIQGFLQNALMILFIEPDIFQRKYMTKILKEAIKKEMGSEDQIEIVEANSAQQGLHLIEHCPSGRRYAFVLCRCQMPVMTGIALCQALKQDVFAAPTVILFDSKQMDIPRGLCAEEILLEYFDRYRAQKLIIEHCQNTQVNVKSRMPHAKHIKPKTSEQMHNELAKSGRASYRDGYKPKPPPKRSAFSKHRFESHAFSPRALQGLKDAAGAESPRRIEVVKKAQAKVQKAMKKLRMATLLGGLSKLKDMNQDGAQNDSPTKPTTGSQSASLPGEGGMGDPDSPKIFRIPISPRGVRTGSGLHYHRPIVEYGVDGTTSLVL